MACTSFDQLVKVDDGLGLCILYSSGESGVKKWYLSNKVIDAYPSESSAISTFIEAYYSCQ